MKKTLIKTISGEIEYINKCKKIGKNYYSIGHEKIENSGDCYLINKKYYRAETGVLKYDHNIKKYTNITSKLTLGIIDIIDNKIILGYFSSINEKFTEYRKVVEKETKILYSVLPSVLLEKNGYFKTNKEDIYHHRTSIPAIYFQKIGKCTQQYKRTLNYSSTELIKESKKNFKKLYNEIPSTQAILIEELLKGLSFGVEFETTEGIIKKKVLDKIGLIPLRDGSINGIEYVTVPHEGSIGVQALIDSIELLDISTKFDNSCSIHIHIGNIPRTEKFILAMFKVLCIVQDDIYTMFPSDKKVFSGNKRKHYTKPFNLISLFGKIDNSIKSEKEIKKNFNILFQFLSAGYSYKDYKENLENVIEHPSDPRGAQKWNIRTRYYWVNLIPIIFGNKKTIEFRIHTPTYDTNKILYFLTIVASLINYTKENQNFILNSNLILDFSIQDIIYEQLKEKNIPFCDYLLDYIYNRIQFIRREERTGKKEVNENLFTYKKGGFFLKIPPKRLNINFGNGIFYDKYKLKREEVRLVPEQRIWYEISKNKI